MPYQSPNTEASEGNVPSTTDSIEAEKNILGWKGKTMRTTDPIYAEFLNPRREGRTFLASLDPTVLEVHILKV